MIRLQEYTPIVLRANNGGVTEYIGTGSSTEGDRVAAVKQFTVAVEESHPGKWNGSQLNIVQDAWLQVSAAITGDALDGVNPEPVTVYFDLNGYHASAFERTRGTPCVDIIRVRAGDALSIVWEVRKDTTVSGQPPYCQLNIVEIVT